MEMLETLAQMSDYEEIQALNANYIAFIAVVRQALEMEESGEADSDDVDATIAQAIEDNAQAALDVFDLEIDVDFEDVNAAGADFGEALAEVLEARYDNPEDGIEDISEMTGVSPEEVQAYLMGRAAPSPDVCRAIADHYLADDRQAHKEFCDLGMEAYESAMAEMGGMNMDDTVNMGGMARKSMSEYSRQDTEDISDELNTIRTIQVEREVSARLRELEGIADDLQSRMILTPAERNSLLRSAQFSKDQDSVATFSQFCFNQGVNPHIYLDNVEFCLNWKMQCGPSNYSAFFSQESNEPMALAETEYREAQSFLDDYRSRHSYQ